ncbi:MAG: hypothetical protein ISR52_09480 [Rhodospirillales bacterium]|nr:hypothetical protein [Rhodospirillales bacterium]
MRILIAVTCLLMLMVSVTGRAVPAGELAATTPEADKWAFLNGRWCGDNFKNSWRVKDDALMVSSHLGSFMRRFVEVDANNFQVCDGPRCCSYETHNEDILNLHSCNFIKITPMTLRKCGFF